jgi:hypothetical protein
VNLWCVLLAVTGDKTVTEHAVLHQLGSGICLTLP